jgi:geranylgeranyl reductase family protein
MQTKETTETIVQQWDVIVVGAGPAGCAAAYDLARAGRSVLLLDKSDFPRSKACAGGLTMKAVRALRYPIDSVIRQAIYRVVLENRGSKPALVKTHEPICVMTVRSELDAFCLAQTLRAGATFRRIRGIRGVQELGENVAVDIGEETVRTRFLLGADGVNSVVRRFCKGAGSTAGGFALETQVPLQDCPVDMTFDFGAVPNGYGWIFPKGNHLNVGLWIYGGLPDGTLTRRQLAAYVQRRLGTEELDHVIGQYLGVSNPEGRCAYGRILLAGDAAGLVDPLTAEGIYSAVVSGQAVAHAIDTAIDAGQRGAEIAAEAYHARLGRLRNTLSFSKRAAPIFYENPGQAFRTLTLPGVRTALIKTYAYGLNSGAGLLSVARRRLNS